MEAERTHVVVTGAGVFTPIGTSVETFRENLRNARGSIDTIKTFDTDGLDVTHAAEIDDYDPLDYFSEAEANRLDRTAQLAILAAQECVEDAGISPETYPDMGLVSGICAGGRGDDAVTLGDVHPWSSREAALSYCRSSQPPQTSAVSRWFDVKGPTATVSTACASSNSALAYGYDLLQSGVTDVVLVGGADAFSPTTYAGFYALRAMSEAPCAPFSNPIGVIFGEAAGFVMLETAEHAEARDASIMGELLGAGGSGDAYHITSPHPSGEGLQRAMQSAVDSAGLDASDVGYVNAHGTGTRGNDSAETLAIRGLFEEADAEPPPASSTKSFYGHTLGAAGVLEFITALIGQNDGFMPPTLNYDEPRPGCDLDYVPNEAREAEYSAFLNNSAAFGGVNAAVVGGTYDASRSLPPRHLDEIVLTGCGVVSPIGNGVDDFFEGLRASQTGIDEIERFDVMEGAPNRAGMIRDFKPRRLVPSLRTRRLDPVSTYATTAAGIALKEAGLEQGAVDPERLGVVMGLSRGPLNVQEDFLNDMRDRGMEGLSAKHFPAMVVSTIAGKVAKTFQLKGFNSMIVEGIASGLHALVHGYYRLQQDDALDALVVIAGDEMASLGVNLYESLGALSHNGFSPYGILNGDADDVIESHVEDAIAAGVPETAFAGGSGMLPGEGGAAVVLERRTSAERRGAEPLARVSGAGLTSSGAAPFTADGLYRSAERALADAETDADTVDAVYGHGRGSSSYDGLEIEALKRLFDAPVAAGCVNGHTGVAEATSGLYSTIASVGSLQHDEVYPLVSDGEVDASAAPATFANELRKQDVDRVLVLGGSEGGINASVVLEAA